MGSAVYGDPHKSHGVPTWHAMVLMLKPPIHLSTCLERTEFF